MKNFGLHKSYYDKWGKGIAVVVSGEAPTQPRRSTVRIVLLLVPLQGGLS